MRHGTRPGLISQAAAHNAGKCEHEFHTAELTKHNRTCPNQARFWVVRGSVGAIVCTKHLARKIHDLNDLAPETMNPSVPIVVRVRREDGGF